MTEESTVFKTLNALNVNLYTQTIKAGKRDLTYLSWSHAWAELLKLYPDSSFRVYENDQGLPYFISDLGLIVKVSVTVESVERICWLPVLDGANKSMRTARYTYETRYGKKTVEAATMFDINTTIMRCLVKAIALHGLGLYIYKGEDLPDQEIPDNVTELPKAEPKAAPKKAAPKVEAKPEFDPDKHQKVFDWFMNYNSIPTAKEEGIPQIKDKFFISKKMETDLINALRVRLQSSTQIPF
jgi:hypothetical protein